MNECDSTDNNNCHNNAICTDTDGSYYCECEVGFFGDGVTCVGGDFNGVNGFVQASWIAGLPVEGEREGLGGTKVLGT